MISKPTNQQLIEAVCAELTAKVAPNITDAGTKIVLEMALSSGSGNRMKDYEIQTLDPRTAAHIEVVMVRDSESIAGMVNHHDKRKATVTSTS